MGYCLILGKDKAPTAADISKIFEGTVTNRGGGGNYNYGSGSWSWTATKPCLCLCSSFVFDGSSGGPTHSTSGTTILSGGQGHYSITCWSYVDLLAVGQYSTIGFNWSTANRMGAMIYSLE